ncbi:metallophosphoesterase [Candidatus Pacearchaeota archaeon]|nr:metallophosphoesterase [Candidatus Pacearchaeota archaeon]
MVKILAAGDIHQDTKQTENLAKLAKKENVDLVVLAGDLTWAESSIDNIIGPFTKVGKKVLIIPGNHETVATADFLAELYPNVTNIHGYAFKFGDIGVFGCGGADMGINVLTEKDVFETLRKGYERLKNMKKKIMVTHMHAAGTGAEFSGFPGSLGIRKAIELFKPDVFIGAHIHEAEGIEEKIGKTKVVQVGKKGKIIEI